jgi:putative phosphoribosyl transferase
MGSSSRELFADRRAAGRALAEQMRDYAGKPDVLVLGLPRGGMPVAHELASRLGAQLDVFVVRKLGVPGHEELAFGALASGGGRFLNEDVLGQLGLTASTVEDVSRRERAELDKRERLYRGSRPGPELRDKTVVLVDDGLATGSTMRAAVQAVREQAPAKVVVAVPVAPEDTCAELRGEADEVICVRTPEPFHAVGLWYADFTPTTDDEVRRILTR